MMKENLVENVCWKTQRQLTCRKFRFQITNRRTIHNWVIRWLCPNWLTGEEAKQNDERIPVELNPAACLGLILHGEADCKVEDANHIWQILFLLNTNPEPILLGCDINSTESPSPKNLQLDEKNFSWWMFLVRAVIGKDNRNFPT